MRQKDLAKVLGLSIRTISRWETGGREPKASTLQQIAEATGKPLSFFFGEDGGKVTTVTIGGVEVEGPADKLADLLRRVQQDAAPDDADRPAIQEGLHPNPRHTGVHQLLDLHEAGELKKAWGIELSAAEEEGLRTYGRSGPAVQTVRQAIDVILQWREWEIRDKLRGR